MKAQRDIIAEQIASMLDDFLLSEVLMSMPRICIKTAAQILLENMGIAETL
ncbi:hypothetical protein ACEN17_09145 [Corynebacterium rouxii]|uniref:hypothetical protein n=1 Tax=Corynebacterium rouxii TaxID=2719119 RepID=UPI001E4E8CD4|nr:hypothetical protein [Corynebacterium rouxii]